MTQDEITQEVEKIEKMDAVEMARLWRFAPAGHPYFYYPLYDHFKKRFASLGGFTPSISKKIEGDVR
jgi:hypothetical protein